MTVTAPTDALSEATRAFLAGPHELLIGGERRPAADGRTFETLDPATGEPIAAVAHGGARRRRRGRGGRARGVRVGPVALGARRPSAALLMNRLADLMEEHADELAEIESLDNGKPVKLARIVDVAGAVAHLRYFAGLADQDRGRRHPGRADRHPLSTRARSRSASAGRSSRGTSRC